VLELGDTAVVFGTEQALQEFEEQLSDKGKPAQTQAKTNNA
jgi:hypothetical protein